MPDDARFDEAVGRYVYLTLDGVEYRVYFEESGTGDVGLLLHHRRTDTRIAEGLSPVRVVRASMRQSPTRSEIRGRQTRQRAARNPAH